MTTATVLAINIPLMVLAFALITGIPMWMIFKHPDRNPSVTRTVPQYRRAQAARASRAPAQQWRVDQLHATTR